MINKIKTLWAEFLNKYFTKAPQIINKPKDVETLEARAEKRVNIARTLKETASKKFETTGAQTVNEDVKVHSKYRNGNKRRARKKISKEN